MNTSRTVSTLHNGDKQGIDGKIFNRKSISRKIAHPQSLFEWNFQLIFTKRRTESSINFFAKIYKFFN